MADHVYVEPLTRFLKKSSKKNYPDSILSTLGGQTGLAFRCSFGKGNCWRRRYTSWRKPKPLPKPEAVKFKAPWKRSGALRRPPLSLRRRRGALSFAPLQAISYRASRLLTLGGTRSGITADEAQLREIASAELLVFSPITQFWWKNAISG